jgi:hypothetical protein
VNHLTKKQAVELTLNRLDIIDEKYTSTSTRASQYIKLAKSIHKGLLDEKEGVYALSEYTYHNYLTAIRNAIKATGRKHPSLNSTIKRKGYIARLIHELPDYSDELKAIKSMPATTIAIGKDTLKKKLHNELKGSNLVKAIELVDGLLIDHPLVTYFVKPKALRESRATKEQSSLTQKGKRMKVYNLPALVKLATNLLGNESYTSVAWAIALLTGRRSVEILYHAEFKKLDNETVMFSGQAKKREGTVAKPYAIPVLADADVVIGALKRLRDMPNVKVYNSGTGTFKGKEVAYSTLGKRELNEAINQNTTGVLNAKAKQLMKDKAEVFKNTRGIYARHCSDTFRVEGNPWDGYNEDEFLKAILGHASTKEIKHYRQVELKNEEGADWLKIAEPKKEEIKKEEKPKAKAKRNTRAGKEIKEIGELIKAYGAKTVPVPVGSGTRKVKLSSLETWHFSNLSAWAYENSEREITQTVVLGNKGNTASAGTGSVDVVHSGLLNKKGEPTKINRFTFRAWAMVAGDLLEQYNARKK